MDKQSKSWSVTYKHHDHEWRTIKVWTTPGGLGVGWWCHECGIYSTTNAPKPKIEVVG